MESGTDEKRGVDAATDQAAAIQKAKRELEHMIDMCPQIMLLVGRDRRVLRTNRALLDMLGQAGYADVLGKTVDELFQCQTDGFFDGLLGGVGGICEAEGWANLPGRGVHPLKFSLIGPAQAEVRVLLVHDATDEKTQEAQQKKAHRKEAIQELVGALSHKINQNLTVISVRAKLMTMAIEKGEIHPEELKRGLADIADLTLKIASTLSDVGRPRDFNTVSYVNGLDILDIEASSGPQGS